MWDWPKDIKSLLLLTFSGRPKKNKKVEVLPQGNSSLISSPFAHHTHVKMVLRIVLEIRLLSCAPSLTLEGIYSTSCFGVQKANRVPGDKKKTVKKVQVSGKALLSLSIIISRFVCGRSSSSVVNILLILYWPEGINGWRADS